MNYYLDFETTTKNQIISIGCITELGETFYSLVKPSYPEQISPILIKLIGVTNKDLQNAPTFEEVCSQFLEFIINSKTKPKDNIRKYYVYGNQDKNFLETNICFLNKTENIAGMIAIQESLQDYQKKVKNFYGKNYRLIDLYNCLKRYNYEQKHNALKDAIMLKEIFGNLDKIKNPEDYKNNLDKDKISKNVLNFSLQPVEYDINKADKKWLDWPKGFNNRFNAQTEGTPNNYFIKVYFKKQDKTVYFITLKEALLWLMKYSGSFNGLSPKKAKNYVQMYEGIKKAIDNKIVFRKGKWKLRKRRDK